MADFEEMLNHLDRPGIDKDLALDIIQLDPGLSYDDAFRLQILSKRRQVERGDRIVGYQASLTSSGARKAMPHIPAPMVGTLLASLVRSEGTTIELDDEISYIEAEVAVLLKSDLEGPHVTAADVLAATEGYLAAMEVAPVRPGLLEKKWSAQHLVAVQKAPGGYVLLGSTLADPRGFDLRLEGAITSIDGEVRGTACAVEAMGNPLNVVAALVRRLAVVGEGVRAGQFVMTGSLPAPQVIRRENRHARIELTRLGAVDVNIAPSN